MMKKNGFTLAEVLITLAIIGVVAVLTLPALMTNTAEQRAKTALKKGINTLTEAGQMNASIEGFDYSSVTSNDWGTGKEESQSLYGLLAQRTAVDMGPTGAQKQLGKGHGSNSSGYSNSSNFTVYFRDGSSFEYNPSEAVIGTGKAAAVIDSDGINHGIVGLYDTNGKQGPNIISYCSGDKSHPTLTAFPGNDSNQPAGTELKDYCSKTGRVIKDQFGVRLRGYYAVPNGAAARWAFLN